MKKAIKISAIALAFVTVGLVYALFNVGESASQTGSVAVTESVSAAVLRKGSKGGEVSEVQRRLKKWGYYSGSIDGIYGENTRKAVINFQKKNGLTADGVVGLATYAALGMNDSYNVLKRSTP